VVVGADGLRCPGWGMTPGSYPLPKKARDLIASSG
jgi:hypothetical protein